MKSYKEFKILNERKQYTDLYHFSSLINIYSIVKMNAIEGIEGWFSNKNPKYNNREVISLTRNKNFGILNPEFSKSYLCFDGEKLTDNYKIIPHNFFYFYDNQKSSKSDKNYEFEETLLLPKGKQYLKNINKYINYIHIPSFDDFYEHYVKYVEMVDWETQLGRVIDIYKNLSDNNPPSLNDLEDEQQHKIFLKEVYNLIIEYLKDKVDLK